jgi:hypothetical protein
MRVLPATRTMAELDAICDGFDFDVLVPSAPM